MKHTLLLAAVLSLPILNVRAQDAPPEFRQRMEALEKRAKEAREAGRGEEAEKLTAEMHELKRQLASRREAAAKDQLRAEMDKAHAELAEAEKNGREEAAKVARHRIAEMKAVIEQMEKERPADKPRRPDGEKPRAEGDQPRGEHPEAREERRRHILQAAEHLHAAGMHDLAERVQREAGGDAPARDGARRDQPQPGRPAGDMEELRQAIRRLNARLDELEKKPR